MSEKFKYAMHLVCDLETDGFLEECTKIWCIVAKCAVTGRLFEAGPDQVAEMIGLLKDCPVISFHNALKFDIPVINKLYNNCMADYRGQIVDTLLLSKMMDADIERPPGCKSGPHSVEAWGRRFGILKPVHEDWTEFTPEMLHRCREDVEIGVKVYNTLVSKIDKSCKDAVKMEHEICKLVQIQEQTGWKFNVSLANELIVRLDSEIQTLDSQIQKGLGLVCKNRGTLKSPLLKSGAPSRQTRQWFGDNNPAMMDVVGSFTRISFEPVNINSTVQVREKLLQMGWEPTKWNYKMNSFGKPVRDKGNNLIKTSPQLPSTDEDAELFEAQTGSNLVRQFVGRSKRAHKMRVIEGLVAAVRDGGRVPAIADSCAAVTGRMRHRVIVNIPKVDVFMGTEMRSLFTCAPGTVLVGTDASALEARVEAHYVRPIDPEHASEILNGDIHKKTSDRLGISRNQAKSVKYACSYGASASKLASTLGCSQSAANAIHTGFWETSWGLAKLKTKLELFYRKNNFIPGLDGRKIKVRSAHAIVNSLFQSAGSILMKRAILIAHQDIEKFNIPAKMVGNHHDEFTFEVKNENNWPKMVAEISQSAIVRAGEYYNLRVPLAGEAKIGTTWAEIH